MFSPRRRSTPRRRSATLAAGLLLAVGVAGGCNSLDINNPNAPDRTRALQQSGDVVNVLGGAFRNWYFSMQSEAPSLTASVMARNTTMSWGNFGARAYSSVPRIGFNNVATDQNIAIVNTPWYNNYSAIASANLSLGALADTTAFRGTTGQADAQLVAAAGAFIQGAAHANIALFFDQGYVVSERTDATAARLQPAVAVRDSALRMLDTAIARAGRATFDRLPNNYLNIQGWTPAQMAQVANTQAARLLAYFPRQASEMSAVNWGRVAQYASRGISGSASGAQATAPVNCPQALTAAGTPGTAAGFCPSIQGDNNIWYDGYKYYGNEWDGWHRVNQRVVALLAPAQPSTYPTTGGRPPAPVPVDRRLDPTPRDDASAGAELTRDFIYAPYDIFNAARGLYHFSDVGHNRYGYHGPLAADGGGLGVVPFMIPAENDLLWAEGLVRSNGSRTLAAQLVNKSRVTRGGLPALTGAETNAAGVAGLVTLPGADNGDVLLRAIYYEREVELPMSSGVTPLYDARRTDRFTREFVLAAGDLANTPRQFPVPAQELEVAGIPIYTFTGLACTGAGCASGARSLAEAVAMPGPAMQKSLAVAAVQGYFGGRTPLNAGQVGAMAFDLVQGSVAARQAGRNRF